MLKTSFTDNHLLHARTTFFRRPMVINYAKGEDELRRALARRVPVRTPSFFPKKAPAPSSRHFSSPPAFSPSPPTISAPDSPTLHQTFAVQGNESETTQEETSVEVEPEISSLPSSLAEDLPSCASSRRSPRSQDTILLEELPLPSSCFTINDVVETIVCQCSLTFVSNFKKTCCHDTEKLAYAVNKFVLKCPALLPYKMRYEHVRYWQSLPP